MKRMQKRYNMETLQHKKKCDMSAPRKNFRMKRLQYEKSKK